MTMKDLRIKAATDGVLIITQGNAYVGAAHVKKDGSVQWYETAGSNYLWDDNITVYPAEMLTRGAHQTDVIIEAARILALSFK